MQGNDSAVATQELASVATDRRSDVTLRALRREPGEVGSTLVEIMQQGDMPPSMPAGLPASASQGTSAVTTETESTPAKRRSGTFLHLLWFGYVVFFAVAIPLLAVGGLPLFTSMAIAGCVTGIVWQLMPRQRAVCGWSAVGIYSLVVLGPRLHTLGDQPLVGAVLLASAALVGWLGSYAPGHCRRVRLASPSRVASSGLAA